MESSASAGWEVVGWSTLRTVLMAQPQLPLYIPEGGMGGPGITLGRAWVSPLTGRFKSPGHAWNTLENEDHVV